MQAILMILCLILMFSAVLGRPPHHGGGGDDGRRHSYHGVSEWCGGHSVWPRPQECIVSGEQILVLPADKTQLKPELIGEYASKSEILKLGFARAVDSMYARITRTFRERGAEPPPDPNDTNIVTGFLDSVQVQIHSAPTGIKTPESDESFQLHVVAPTARIVAQTEWGALYGLEMLSQLVTYHPPSSMTTTATSTKKPTWLIYPAPLNITSAPVFPYRGLLIDTANHFLPIATIERAIAAMSHSAMNILHWHIVDSYSFPFISKSLPRLSQFGSWSPAHTYTEENITHVVEFARVRGVRVVVELEIPGHAYSWGLGYPNITVDCPQFARSDLGHVNTVPLNPTNPDTYEAVDGLLKDLTDVFPDSVLHLGGDEVIFGCWNESAAIHAWMKEHHMVDFVELEAYFVDQVWPKVRSALHKTVMVWEEAFVNVGSRLQAGDIVEVWSNSKLLSAVVGAGLNAVMASPFYLDRQIPVDGKSGWFWEDTWRQMYTTDILQGVPTQFHSRVLGGEACMWSEQVDGINFDSRVWPRAAAVGERLWSFGAGDVVDTVEASMRLAAHRCRLVARGIGAGPVWSDNCEVGV